MADKDELGRAGEQLACEWLTTRGWTILDRNWRCAAGEVDIVAVRDEDLVFFEVKTRSSIRFGYPIEAITGAKLSRMRRVAGEWVHAHRGVRGRIRLDLIGILSRGGTVEFEHVEAVG